MNFHLLIMHALILIVCIINATYLEKVYQIRLLVHTQVNLCIIFVWLLKSLKLSRFLPETSLPNRTRVRHQKWRVRATFLRTFELKIYCFYFVLSNSCLLFLFLSFLKAASCFLISFNYQSISLMFSSWTGKALKPDWVFLNPILHLYSIL